MAGDPRAGADVARGGRGLHRTPLTLHFPDPVASAVESEDAAVQEAVGDLCAQLIAGRAPDHADAVSALMVPTGDVGRPGSVVSGGIARGKVPAAMSCGPANASR